jgi:RNA polymerase sigma-70 factor (ECF subfamily)
MGVDDERPTLHLEFRRADEPPVTIGAGFPEVLAAARVGAAWAWERLFESVARGVRGYLAAQGAVDPDDLTGEVMLQLVRGLPTFEGDEAGFRSWVFLVAHHRVIDERRRRRRDADLASEQGPPDAAPGADAALLDDLDAEWRARLAQLSADQRHVILLRVVAGLPAEDVARILGKRVGTVRVLQHRALARLRAGVTAGVTE